MTGLGSSSIRLATRWRSDAPIRSAHEETSRALSLSTRGRSICSHMCSSRVSWYALASMIRSSACSAESTSETSSVRR
eukprot:scaffold194719_cov30-Tisochrysis_lutea.AAC.2